MSVSSLLPEISWKAFGHTINSTPLLARLFRTSQCSRSWEFPRNHIESMIDGWCRFQELKTSAVFCDERSIFGGLFLKDFLVKVSIEYIASISGWPRCFHQQSPKKHGPEKKEKNTAKRGVLDQNDQVDLLFSTKIPLESCRCFFCVSWFMLSLLSHHDWLLEPWFGEYAKFITPDIKGLLTNHPLIP